MVPKKTTHYEQILRAIGQGLEALSVRAFDLEVDGNKYIIRGNSETFKKEKIPKASGSKHAIHNLWSKSQTQSSRRTPPGKFSSSFVFLGMQFTPEEIDRLERQGQALRFDWESSPNAQRLSQILRTVGAYVDHKGGRLLRVSRRNQWVTIWYRSPLGGERVEEFSRFNLYDLWVHMYKQRRHPIGIRRNGTAHGRYTSVAD